MADLLGTKRNKKFVRARQHAMWLCHQKTRFSTLRLGKFFQRDHTTVLHAIQAHEARMKGGA
jgi:chromosomal replication initiator protein